MSPHADMVARMGLPKARLARMHDVLAGHVARGALPGLVTLVSRHGETHVDAIGTMSAGGAEPMHPDTLFRVSSMTKPVTAAAAMILVEECRLRLDDPVDDLLPELADRRVLRDADGPLHDTVPARRAITLRDLLTFRMGFGVLGGSPPIVAAAEERSVAPGPPAPASLPEPDEYLRRLGELPLMYQPGERWLYQTSAEVLGVLAARATGQTLEAFLRERLFEPLGMVDTAFSVSAEQAGRLGPCYVRDGEGLRVYDPADGQWVTPPAFQSGSDGLVSTVQDYLAFGQMMLNGGRLGAERVLSRPSVELMTMDHLTAEQKAVSGMYPGFFDNQGWGFGMAVATRRDEAGWVPGRFGWDGGLGTGWFSDPVNDLVCVVLTPVALFPMGSPAYQDFWTLAYQAVAD
jgi:CubicO group peptidase (beta-lactamase class C family)